jgi:hypothetical protein
MITTLKEKWGGIHQLDEYNMHFENMIDIQTSNGCHTWNNI